MAKKTQKKTVKRKVRTNSKDVVKAKKNLTTITNRLGKETEGMMIANATLLRQSVLSTMLNDPKDINESCGYPDEITIAMYKEIYKREGIAKRVVNILPEDSWTSLPLIFETEKSNETEFEMALAAMIKDNHLYHYLQRADKLSGIGTFGILLLGIDDGKELSKPVDGINEKTGEMLEGKRERKLIYLKPFDESVVTIDKKESDTKSPRYGMPVVYGINFENITGSSTTSADVSKKLVHWTRVIHIADNREMSEINGTPRMEPVYNRLLDIRKVLSGSGEMFWKGAFPGYSFEVTPEAADSTIDTAAIREELTNYMNGLQRYLAITGVTAKSLEPQVSDPKSHLTCQLQYIAITLSIPFRIFLGSEQAKLASTQDKETWNERIAKRQEGYLSPMIIRPFIDRMMGIGILPQVEEYKVEWTDLNTPTDEDKATVAKIQTEAMAKYVQADVASLIGPKEFFMIVMGMTEEVAQAIEDSAIEQQDDSVDENELDDDN